MTQQQSAPVSVLTDGTGISAITTSKFVKDLIADFLLTLSATLGAGAAFDAFDLGAAISTPDAIGIGIAGAAIRSVYRALLRWATT